MDDQEIYEEILSDELLNTQPDSNSPGVGSAGPAPAGEKAKNNGRLELYDWLQCVVFAVLMGILLFVFVGRTIGVDGSSMLPTLHHSDRVITSNLFYAPENGDIVIVKTDKYGNTPIVKRIIAVAGQTIDIDFGTGDVIIDGMVINEPYIQELTRAQIDFMGPRTVPDGCVFVMGDNRNHSLDSRHGEIDMIDTRRILGKVLMILLPGVEEDTGTRTWGRFGSMY